MTTLSSQEFANLAQQGYNRIPLMAEVLADLDTPLSTYLKLANKPYCYLLESVQGGEKWGRYSIIGLPARTQLRVTGHDIAVTTDGQAVEHAVAEDPLAWIETFAARYRVPTLPGLPRFTGGLVGYFGYDTVRYIEPRLGADRKPDPLGTSDIFLLVSDEVIVFDNLSGKLYLVVHVDPAQPDAYTAGQKRLATLIAQLRNGVIDYDAVGTGHVINDSDFSTAISRTAYEQSVEKIRGYIRAGDVFQVVLSQRMSTPFHASPLQLYRALRGLNPSPYMFFFDFDDFQVVGSSPEILVRLEDNIVTVRPIAGTRPRGKTDEQDRALEQELLADPKECAEHLMLIDLGRNDVGRVSEVGSVRVTDKMVIERYSHVMHIVSNVCGKVGNNVSAMDVLRATFPAGTVSGAPKIRAMEVIDELEPVKRGIYAGAVGYLGWSGNMDTAIAIRTAIIKNQRLYIQAGAGIVADSIPANEWEETMNKGRAIFRAAAKAEAGLDLPPQK